MKVKTGLHYTQQHEWIDAETGRMGITDFAQDSLGDITFIDVPAPGKKVAKGKELAAIESSKAASSIYAPVSGEVVEANEKLAADPGLVNTDCYGDGWVCRLSIADKGELDQLMQSQDYEKFLASQEG